MNVSYRFLKFLDYPCFEVKESIADISTELLCLGDFENPGWLPVQHVPGGTWGLCPVDFWNFFTIYVLEVSESFHDIFLLRYYVWETSKIQVTFWFKRFSRLPKPLLVPWQKSLKFISSRAKVAGRSHDQRFIIDFIVMSRNVMSCHVMPRHATSCHVMSHNVT